MMKSIITLSMLGLFVILAGCNERNKNGNLLHSLTPNMSTLDDTYSERVAQVEDNCNANDRMFNGDWDRLFMVDQPSSLTPMPVVRD